MTPEELDDLIGDCLSGEADPERIESLDRELASRPEAARRLAELSLQESLLFEIGHEGRPSESLPNTGRRILGWVSLAAAGLLLGILVLSSAPERPPSRIAGPSRLHERPTAPESPSPEPVPPRRSPGADELPAPKIAVPPRKEVTPSLPAPKPPPAPPPPGNAAPPETPSERPAPAVPPKSTPDKAVYAPVQILAASGSVWRRRDGNGEPVRASMEVSRGDQLQTRHRRGASLGVNIGCTVWLDRDSELSVEHREDGSSKFTLSSGAAFFEVGPRTALFVVATLDGEAVVTGTSFMVERDDKRTSLSVLEGAVQFRSEKGEVLVRAGYRSVARFPEKPSSPARADVEAAAAWRLRPEYALEAPSRPFTDHELGASRKYGGLVLAAPFYEGELPSGRLARAAAEGMDVGLVLGHHFRDLSRRTWINVDRGMEAEVRTDGTLGPEAFSERARKATADYLDHARQAGGAGPRLPVPMIVQFRNHYLTQGGADLEVCEVALAGWDRRTVAGLKAVYAQLLEKQKPSYRMDMRFQGVDDTYDYKGTKRSLTLTESDARLEGYMAPRNARSAAAFFLSPGFGKREEDYDAYSKIFAELIEYLYLRRR
jgi:hypothetical protein